MKKLNLLISLLIATISLNAQDYLISFGGSGASTQVSTVKVENLTQGKSVTLNGTEILHLMKVITGITPVSDDKTEFQIYPNPTNGKSTIDFVATASGKVNIELFDIKGKRIATVQNNLKSETHSYQISNLQRGIYTVRISSQSYNYTAKLVSNGNINSDVNISYLGNGIIPVTSMKLKSANAEKTMQYNTGDRLRILGTSGNYTTTIIDIPTQNKTITFPFVVCTDGDGNNYPVVQIGTQTWMVENLTTTKYNDGTVVPNVTDGYVWRDLTTPGYCYYNNDAPTNKTTYGALYNWYTVNTGKLAPKGWHVPTDAEWKTLTDYLTDNGYGYGGSGYNIAKSMAATSGWNAHTNAGTVGNDQASNNRSGFTALPGGFRNHDGTFSGIGGWCQWWRSTDADYYEINSAWTISFATVSYGVGRYNYYKNFGFSVRCIKD